MLRSFKVIDVGTPESSSAVLVVIRSKSVSICSGSHARRANSDFLVGVPLFGAVVQQKYPRTQRMWQTTDRPRHGEMCSYRRNGLRCKKRLRVKRKKIRAARTSVRSGRVCEWRDVITSRCSGDICRQYVDVRSRLLSTSEPRARAASVDTYLFLRTWQQEIWANAHETRHSISLTSYAGCHGLSPVYFSENSV